MSIYIYMYSSREKSSRKKERGGGGERGWWKVGTALSISSCLGMSMCRVRASTYVYL